MKKNMVSILIMALVTINVVLSALIIFVMMPTMNKMDNLLTDIAAVIHLELEDPNVEEEEEISIADTETLKIDSPFNINLKADGSGTLHYAGISSISITLNKKAEDFSEVQALLSQRTVEITEIINNTFAQNTLAEANGNRDKVKNKVLEQLKVTFETDCILNVAFGNLVFQ